jgi:hypothetical protein
LEGGRLLANSRQISLEDLVPHPTSYFNLLFQTLRDQNLTK